MINIIATDSKIHAWMEVKKVSGGWRFESDLKQRKGYSSFTDYIKEANQSINFDDYVRRVDLANFNKDESQKAGKVYTPFDIVTWMHSKIVTHNPISLHKTYWEPSCGSGSFVEDWYDRLMKHWKENKEQYSDIQNIHEAHKWIIEKCLYFSDLDSFSLRLCCLRLYFKDPTVRVMFNKFSGDALLDNPFSDIIKFDYIVGNPPYISFHTGGLDTVYKQKLKSQYNFYASHGDILNLFFELGMKRARFFSYVTSRYWMRTECLKVKRKQLTPYLLEIEDHGSDDNKIDGATVRTACFIFGESGTEEFIFNNSKFKREDLDEAGWDFNIDPICAKMKQKKLSDYCNVYDGVMTGCHEVFIINESLAHDSFASKKAVSGKNIRKWITEYDGKRFVDACTKEEYDLQSTPEAQFIKANEERLLKRPGGVQPYEYTGSGKDNWGNKEGILARSYMDYKHFGFALREDYYGLSSNVFLLETTNSKQIMAILNSRVMEYYFIKKIKRRANNYMFTTGSYKLLPMPRCLNSCLDPLVDKMLLDPNDKVTEAEINKIVYELYNLTPEEIKTIEEIVKC